MNPAHPKNPKNMKTNALPLTGFKSRTRTQVSTYDTLVRRVSDEATRWTGLMAILCDVTGISTRKAIANEVGRYFRACDVSTVEPEMGTIKEIVAQILRGDPREVTEHEAYAIRESRMERDRPLLCGMEADDEDF